MKCRHCRASAADAPFYGEFTTEECECVLESLKKIRPMIIWTGGEPMTRDDLPRLVSRASSLGMRSVLAPCGMLVTEERLRDLKEAGVMACSFSLDGAEKSVHDDFRGVDGAWEAMMEAMAAARKAGMPFQVNTVVRKGMIDSLDAIYGKAMSEGAARLDLFFLVPTGRACGIDALVPDARETEAAIEWAKGKNVKLTCCPQAGTCIGGRGFAFLSHTGSLQTCGFVQVSCGNIRDFGLDFVRMLDSAVNPLGVSGNCRVVQG